MQKYKEPIRFRMVTILLGILFPMCVFAQQITVQGIVKDQTGEPVIGAAVVQENTTNGTITDFDGKFVLTLPEDSKIRVSYVGYASQTIPVKGMKEINVILKEDTEMLNEVVVIGYGSVAKKELTSAVSHVSSKDFLNVGSSDPAMQIQGKVAGVSIDNAGAADPNVTSGIQVRGLSSRSAGTGPLIVIDGVPGGNLQNLNSNDIESIDILKDGAASAIYGTRGSNGVVLVTTKKGSTDGTVHTSYSGYVSVDMISNALDVLSADEFRELRVPQGGTDYGADTDWMKEITRTGFSHTHALTVSGGNAQNNYRATVDFRQANGVDLRSDRKEWGARASFNHTSKNGLFKFTANIAPRFINKNNSNWEAFDKALLANPTTPVYDPADPAGKKYFDFKGQEAGWNPVEKLELEQSYDEAKYLDWDATAKLNLLPLLVKGGMSDHSLTTQLTIAQQINDNMNYWFIPSTATTEINAGRKGEAAQNYTKNRQESLEWLVNYGFEKNGHNVRFMGGYSYQYWMNNGLNAENKDFASDALGWNNLGNGEYNQEEGRNGMGSYRNDSKLIAFFGRVSYDYKQRYLFTASLRYEGSSKFGANNKWGYFPAVSAGWRVSDEDFMKNIKWVNDLKVRADLGITGNQNFDSYRSLATYGGFGWVFYNGAYYQGWAPGKNVNPDLKWEKGVNWNIGLDFSLFDYKLTGSVNYYNRKQQDLLGDYTVPIPPYLYNSTFVNVGTMKNTGLEIDLNIQAVKTKDFTCNIGFVGATNNNKFVKFSNELYKGNPYVDVCDMPSPNNPGKLQRIAEGERIGNFRTWSYAGTDENGNWLVWNKDNTEKIPVANATEDDKRITGNGLPKFTASLSNTFSYKNWDLSLYFRGAFGFDIFNVHDLYYGLQGMNKTSNVLKKAYGENAAVSTGSNVLTDYFMEKGDYVKLDVVTLGCTLNPEKKFLERIRLYATARNLATVTGFGGVDPASYQVNGLTPGTFGGSKNYYPSTIQLLFGVQVNF